MFILSAPSGTGKTTLAKMIKVCDQHIHTSISVTTRQKRIGEKDGREYIFISRDEFKQMVDNDEFLEYAEVFGNLYGTPKKFVEEKLAAGEDVLFDIDWQGHRQIISTARDDVASVFLLPPSKDELAERLITRHMLDMDKSTVEYRLKEADSEIMHWHEYDYVVINKYLDQSLSKLISILKSERLKKERRTGLKAFIASLVDHPNI